MKKNRDRLFLLVTALLASAFSGCHAYHNRFTPARDQPRAMQRADGLVTAGERALDNARQQADNIVN